MDYLCNEVEDKIMAKISELDDRRGKRHRIDLISPQFVDELERVIDLIATDQSLPPHLKPALGYLFEMRKELNEVPARTERLLEENKLFKKNCMVQSEINKLMSRIDFLKKSLSDKSPLIAGISECDSQVLSIIVCYDVAYIRRINEFRFLDSHPDSVYRIARFTPGRPRFLKVLLPFLLVFAP
ncbi:hypothetical protein COOONC_09940 [Cooperia oncophora]